jgi:maleylpyruvate isomerase
MTGARGWMDQHTKLFLSAVESLTDAEFDVPTGLPGWTRRHLIAHVHFNAEALRRLVSWAATSTENRMYASPDQRLAEIESGAQLPPTTLRQLVVESADALARDLDGLDGDAWSAQVLTAQGRTVPATEIPWMRSREVAIHAVDLGSGVGFDDLAPDFVRALLADVVGRRASQGEGAGLAAWLTGRAATAPVLGPWL